ncbi:MAG: hypothetical protein F4Z88_07100 [Chloroflexi bacterium]|nr:hypothetical protein [Chloroflexota bacterium]
MTTQTALTHADSPHTWTIAETKARLSEILRLADEQGPQRIGVQRAFIVVPERVWRERAHPRKPLGQWLVENFPRGIELELPSRDDDDREIPFADEANR